jgi:ABC-type Fe3+ transport system substrate-binding protein
MVQAAAKGAPIVRVLTPEVPILSYFYLTVPKNATNPNAAKLFITYALSAKGQRDVYNLDMSDLHLFPESELGKTIRAAEQKYNFKYKEADIAWQEVANDEGNDAQRQIQGILREGRH